MCLTVLITIISMTFHADLESASRNNNLFVFPRNFFCSSFQMLYLLKPRLLQLQVRYC